MVGKYSSTMDPTGIGKLVSSAVKSTENKPRMVLLVPGAAPVVVPNVGERLKETTFGGAP